MKTELTQNITDYAGPSMKPTLLNGDELCVVPYEENKIRPGDVVVFYSQPGGKLIVHRVVSITADGIRMKGDNNLEVDRQLLYPDEIIGRVESIKRMNRTIIISGGFFGQLRSFRLGIKKRAGAGIRWVLRPLYKFLSLSGIFQNLPFIKRRLAVHYFNRPMGLEMQLYFDKQLIGKRLPGSTYWSIRRPFRLFIDPNSLPDKKTTIPTRKNKIRE